MGQTIISAGLIVLVTIAVINANRLIINSQTTKLEAQARLEASDIALEIITEARMRRFDERATDTSQYYSASAFTDDSDLGPESGESFALPDTVPYKSPGRYNDYDDYNGYRRKVSTTTLTGYNVWCKVYYATPTYPDKLTNSRTYVKTLEVYISHPLYLEDTLRISMTKTY